MSRFVGAIEAAQILNVGRSTIQRWVDAGALPAVRTVGGHRRIREADLQQFMIARQAEPVAAMRATESILLVDDDQFVLTFLEQAILSVSDRYAIHTATNGFEAGVLFVRHLPTLVFLDIMMPGIDGVEVCQRMRTLPESRGTRIVGITGSEDPDLFQRMSEAGADVILQKPVGLDQVREQLAITFPLRATA